jgi:hypothetical protein
MATGPAAMGGIGLAVLNSVFFPWLTAGWLGNYRQFRSTMGLGLVGSGAVRLLENLVAVYFLFDGMTSLYSADPLVGQVVLAMRSLQFAVVGLLTYVTVK